MAYFRQRGDKWSYTINAGTDPATGKRRQITKSGFTSEKDARRAAVKVEQELEAGKKVVTPTLQEFALQFFETQVKSQVTPHTYYTQMNYLTNYIIPKLGRLKLDKITYMQIERFYSDLLEEGMHRGTIKIISLVLKKTFRTAQKWNYIINNVMNHVKTPSYKPAKVKVWTADEVKRFLDGAKGTRFEIAYILALTTGMRLGEILGLHWADIDFHFRQLTVTRSLKYDTVNKLHLKATKTDSSQRTIALPDATIEALREHQKNQLAGMQMVVNFIDHYAFPSDVSREFRNLCNEIGVPRIRFHDMRHTHATLLLQRGVNVKVVAERLGHSNVTTTLNTYAHVLPSMQRDAADMFNSLL